MCPDGLLIFLKAASLMDLLISVNHDTILLVTSAINHNVTHDFFLSYITHIQSVNVFCWLTFKNIQNLTISFTFTVTMVTNPPSDLVCLSAHKFLTDILASTFPQPYPHTVYLPHSSQCNPLKTYVISHPLLTLHNYFPLTQTDSQVLTSTSEVLLHLTPLSVIISCYFHSY